MRGRKIEEAQSPQPEGWALSLLADVLKAGPPMLSEIIGCLEQIETVKEFRALVRMLLAGIRIRNHGGAPKPAGI